MSLLTDFRRQQKTVTIRGRSVQIQELGLADALAIAELDDWPQAKAILRGGCPELKDATDEQLRSLGAGFLTELALAIQAFGAEDFSKKSKPSRIGSTGTG